MQFRNAFSTMGALRGHSVHNPVFIIILLVSTTTYPRIGAATTGTSFYGAFASRYGSSRPGAAAASPADSLPWPAANSQAAARPLQEAVRAAAASTTPNSESKHFQAAKHAFLRRYGHHYGYKGWLDQHWQQEVGYRFGSELHHYLDFTGASLYTRSHITAANQFLEHHTLSNPHSRNPSSLAAERQLNAARRQVLEFFNADEELYTVVWTSGATAALKLVGESFPWSSGPDWHPSRHTHPGGYSDTDIGVVNPCGAVAPGADSTTPTASHFVYTRSNHKSVLGIGGYAKARGVVLSCVDEEGMEDWLNSSSDEHKADREAVLGTAKARGKHYVSARLGLLHRKTAAKHGATSVTAAADSQQPEGSNAGRTLAQQALSRKDSRGGTGKLSAGAAAAAQQRDVTFSLVAYPSKDNYEGRLYPMDWINKVHAKSTKHHKWLVVLDAAAYVPTHPLDLSKVHPDFVPVSWYKVFGFPTGLGALLARKDSLALLHKYYFGGGSVVDATAEDAWRVLMPPPDGYEDGTQSFLSIAQLQFGFAQLNQLGGIQAVERHVQSLQAWLYDALSNLKHDNGTPVVTLFGHHHTHDLQQQSCIFQMLVRRPDGSVVSSTQVEQAAVAQGIGIRTGCMCNPSQCNFDLGIRPEEHRAAILNNTDVSSGFLTVWRPSPDGSPKLQPVQMPVGSVRVSLGYLSTFKDVYAFVHFLRKNYQTRSRGVAAVI